jgi:hypothetical protein
MLKEVNNEEVSYVFCAAAINGSNQHLPAYRRESRHGFFIHVFPPIGAESNVTDFAHRLWPSHHHFNHALDAEILDSTDDTRGFVGL